MSSVQGSGSTISSGAIDRVRKLLDELDGKAALTNLPTAMRLREQLEKNVKTKDAATALVGELSGTQRDVLREVLPSLPTVKAFFKDAFDRAPGPHDDVNNPDHGRERNVRRSGSAKINDGRTVDVSAIQSSAPARGRSRRGVEEPESATAQGEPQVARAKGADAPGPAETATQAVDGAAAKSRRAKGAPVDAAANSDVAADAGASAAAGPADKTDGAPAATTAPTDGSTTASGAPTDVPKTIHEVLDQTIDFIKAHLSPQSDKAFRDAAAIAEKLQRDRKEFDGYRQALAKLEATPKPKRTAEQKKEILELKDKLRGAPDLKELEGQFIKIRDQLETMPNRVGLLQAWFGLEKNRPSLDDDTAEGRRTQLIFDELLGRETNLPPDIKQRIAEFRKTDEGKRALELMPNMRLMQTFPAQFDAALKTGEIKTGDRGLDSVITAVLTGHVFTEEDVKGMLGPMPPPAANPATPGSGDPKKPAPGSTGAAPASPSHGEPFTPRNPGAQNPEQDKWFNPLNRNWFGLSRIRHDQLKNDGHTELLNAIQEYNAKTQQMHMVSATRLNSMMSILNSGLPIESILLLFMGMMTENEEDKLRLKMAEIVVAEQFERTNRKLQADQNFARDLVKKYQLGIERPEHRENINPEQLEKMAGLEWTAQITPEDAARSNARGNAFKTLRAEGMGKLQEKLDKIQFKDGVLDPEGLKQVGLTADNLKTAGIANQADLDLFKGQAEAHSPKHIEDLIGEKPIQREARFIDVTLNPMDFGFTTKPSQALVQELQVQMQNYKQIMETFTSVIRMLQDIVARITQNIR